MSVSFEAETNQHYEIRTTQPPNIWNDPLVLTSQFDPDTLLEFDQKYGNQIEELKTKVKEWLVDTTKDVVEKIKLIDILCRFDVSYHFETEIDEQLKGIFESHDNFLKDNDYDLYIISLLFRILRTHGYQISVDYFNKFKDNDGKFKESLTSDLKGMLAFYEATFLDVRGEDILVEALEFSKAHLTSLAEKSNPNLAKQINNALELPFHKSMARLEALKFISIYEQEESKNELLLLLGKLDCARVQLLHQKELNHLLTWWKDLKLASILPHVRDRVIEAFLWAAIMYSEPPYSRARIMLSKIIMLITLVDDTQDSYATYEEQKLLDDAIQRWDAEVLDGLPYNIKIVYEILLDEFDKLTNELTSEERYRAPYVKYGLQRMYGAYMVEAEWVHKNQVPKIPEYREIGHISAGSYGFVTAAFMGVDKESADINVFEWVLSRPKILKAAYEITRFKNDVVSHLRGEDRDHKLCGVECWLKEGLSMEEIFDNYNNVIAVNAWRDMNEEYMKPSSPVSKDVLIRLINNARLMEVTYKDGDGYTYPNKLKDMISMLFIDNISI